MRRFVLSVVLLVGLLVACGGREPISETDLALRIHVGFEGGDEIELGRAFPLRVVRVWSKDLELDAWEDRLLAPLRLHLVDARRREDASRVEETRRYRAYAFTPGEVVVPAARIVARPRAGGEARVARADGLRIRVRSTLDPASPGPPEPPPEPLAERVSPWPWVRVLLGALLVLGLGVAVQRRVRRGIPREPPSPPPAPSPSAGARALTRLAALRSHDATDVAGLTADVLGVADVVRDYVGSRLHVRATVLTSEELVDGCASADAFASSFGPRLSHLLGGGDRVKFAAYMPSSADRAALLDAAESFVRDTAPASIEEDVSP